MLPITHHRTLHVPHSLAVIAAALALVVAGLCSMNRGPVLAGEPDAMPSVITASESAPTGSERHDPAAGRSGSSRSAPTSSLMPLFLPRGSHR